VAKLMKSRERCTISWEFNDFLGTETNPDADRECVEAECLYW
jgi:hypothetical protein